MRRLQEIGWTSLNSLKDGYDFQMWQETEAVEEQGKCGHLVR